MGHKEWLGKGWKTVVRGYVDSTGIYFYRGENYGVDRGVREAASSHANKIRDVQEDKTLRVFCGVEVGPVGERWEATEEIEVEYT